MKEHRPHVKLNAEQQREPSVVLDFNYGFGDEGKKDNPIPDYKQIAQSFEINLNRFRIDVQSRMTERNPLLKVPSYIEYIQIHFQGQFALKKYFQEWRNDFGLEAVHVSDFGTCVLFAVINPRLGDEFIRNIQQFINRELKLDKKATYSRNLVYMKSFQLLTTTSILNTIEAEPLVNLQLVDLPLETEGRKAILQTLGGYLDDHHLSYVIDENTTNLEVTNATREQLLEIVQNFDVVLQVTSALATIIRPDQFNLPERSYGFSISNSEEDLPIIGVVDTGISGTTPLAPIIIIDEDLNLTSSPVNQDNMDSGRGHGTAVGALAALGKRPYNNQYSGELMADARLLPIKVMDARSAYLSQHAIIQKMVLAKAKYPSIKIFVLAIGYQQHKSYNDSYSTYAYELDKFAYENDCLVCISAGNNNEAGLDNTGYDLSYFDQEKTNLCIPAESMNNLTIGAASHSLKSGNHIGIATSKEYPTIYSRKSHIHFKKLRTSAKSNKSLFKPDVIECGGDYSFGRNGGLSDVSDAAMEVLSADTTESFYRQIGTSFSAPLVANAAVNIQRQYPSLRAATIKALIINGASLDLIALDNKLLNPLSGHGLVNENASVFSSKNRITFVIEDTINSEQVKIIPLYFPEYLTTDDLKKKMGILRLTATLSFQFKPVLQNQQAYCPLHIAFGIFRNHTGDQIQLPADVIKSTLKGNMWSQNGRYITKPIPYSNVQKISIPINKHELLDENSTFKIAVQCLVHPQLLPGQENDYLLENPFSIVLTLEENLPEQRLTGKLYDEITAINETLAIHELYTDLDLEAEA